MRYIMFLLVLAVGCGGPPPEKSSGPVVIVMDNNDTTTPNNISGSNNAPDPVCCGGRQCGAAPGCETSCGTCGDDAFCDDAGACIAAAADAPRIIDFSTNVTTITPNDIARFSAIVTDPDGIDDLIGGTLKSPSGATFGSFQTAAAEGSYQLEVTWNDINTVQPIVFDRSVERTFIAEFFDQAGNRVQREVTLTLACANAATESACAAGQCVDTSTSNEHCGSCGNSLADSWNAYCQNGTPTCEERSQTYCPAVKVCAGWDVPEACGSCGNNCEDLAAIVGVTIDNETNYLWCNGDGDVRGCQIDFNTTSRDSCATQCATLTCISAWANYENGTVNANCAAMAEPSYPESGAFVGTNCVCVR